MSAMVIKYTSVCLVKYLSNKKYVTSWLNIQSALLM